MDLPIQIKFFKKLELYQELIDQNNKKKETKSIAWNIEKDVLKWTSTGHHHLGTWITENMIKTDINILKGKYQNLEELKPAVKSLVERGFARMNSQNDSSIIITHEGLLMGQVVKDYEDGKYRQKIKYPFFIYLTWLTILSSSFLIIYNAILIILNDYILSSSKVIVLQLRQALSNRSNICFSQNLLLNL